MTLDPEFVAKESSVQDARPIEIYTFTLPTGSYYVTAHGEDVTRGGTTYRAVSMTRSTIAVAPQGSVRECVITMPVDDVVIAALFRNGIPPQGATMTIRKFHDAVVTLGGSQLIFSGIVGPIETDEENATIKCTESTGEMFRVRLPIAVAQRGCQHKLYDEGCQQPEAAFAVSTTVNGAPVGLTIVVASVAGKPDGWFRDGKIKRALDTEERSIVDHVGTTLTVDIPFDGLASLEVVTIYAGCDLTPDGVNGCSLKFGNIANYGGHPEMPDHNPMSPTGFGVVTQG